MMHRETNVTRLLLVASLALVALSACGGDDTSGDDTTDDSVSDDALPAVTCTVRATATADTTAKTITGVGSATCTGKATLEVETCVQYNPSGTYSDIQCMSGTMSNVDHLEVENLASCGLSTANRMYRARVNVTVGGTAQAEVLSTMIACQ